MIKATEAVHRQIRAKKEADERSQAHREKVERRQRKLEQEKELRRQKRAERQARAMGTLPRKRAAAAAAQRRARERRQSQIDAQQDAGNAIGSCDATSNTGGDKKEVRTQFSPPLAAGPLIQIATESGVLDRLAVGELLTTKQPEAAAHAPSEGGYHFLYAFVRAHSSGGALAAMRAHANRRKLDPHENASAERVSVKAPTTENAATLSSMKVSQATLVGDGPGTNGTSIRARKNGGARDDSDDVSDKAAYNEPLDDDEASDVQALSAYMRDHVRIEPASKFDNEQLKLKPEQRRHYARLLVRMGYRNGKCTRHVHCLDFGLSMQLPFILSACRANSLALLLPLPFLVDSLLQLDLHLNAEVSDAMTHDHGKDTRNSKDKDAGGGRARDRQRNRGRGGARDRGRGRGVSTSGGSKRSGRHRGSRNFAEKKLSHKEREEQKQEEMMRKKAAELKLVDWTKMDMHRAFDAFRASGIPQHHAVALVAALRETVASREKQAFKQAMAKHKAADAAAAAATIAVMAAASVIRRVAHIEIEVLEAVKHYGGKPLAPAQNHQAGAQRPPSATDAAKAHATYRSWCIEQLSAYGVAHPSLGAEPEFDDADHNTQIAELSELEAPLLELRKFEVLVKPDATIQYFTQDLRSAEKKVPRVVGVVEFRLASDMVKLESQPTVPVVNAAMDEHPQGAAGKTPKHRPVLQDMCSSGMGAAFREVLAGRKPPPLPKDGHTVDDALDGKKHVVNRDDDVPRLLLLREEVQRLCSCDDVNSALAPPRVPPQPVPPQDSGSRSISDSDVECDSDDEMNSDMSEKATGWTGHGHENRSDTFTLQIEPKVLEKAEPSVPVRMLAVVRGRLKKELAVKKAAVEERRRVRALEEQQKLARERLKREKEQELADETARLQRRITRVSVSLSS
eukprot:g397.t1